MLYIYKIQKFGLTINRDFAKDVEKIFSEYCIYYKKIELAEVPEVTRFKDCEIRSDEFESLCERLKKIPANISIGCY